MKIHKNTLDKINRLLLRSIPLIPGPELYDIFEDLKKSKVDVNEKINKAYVSLRETSDLIEDLQNDLKNRTKKVEELREQYEHYSKLAEIEQAKIQPLMKELRVTLNKGRRREWIMSFVINLSAGLLLFILGIWLSPKITPLFMKTPEQQVEKSPNISPPKHNTGLPK